MKTPYFFIVLIPLALAGCPLVEDADDATPAAPPPGSSELFPEEVVEGDVLDQGPSGLAAEIFDAAAACGWTSVMTVPPGWQPVAVSNEGCTQWIPLQWSILGHAENLGFSPELNRGTYAFTLFNPLSTGYAWGPDGTIDFMMDSIAVEFGTEPPEVLWRNVSDVVDLEVVDAAFTFSKDGEPTVGALRVHFGGCDTVSGVCSALIMGYWLPLSEMEESICDLVQVDSSLQCPGLGTCVAPVCHSWCVRAGSESGACQFDGCICN